MPADPMPDTLDYITVYDNYNLGGFAGGASVGLSRAVQVRLRQGLAGDKLGD